ncbi:MAG: heme-binding protein [Bacteroidetes bacterium HGW-Bacteroidetes-13]|nr:MAG: heme-binding protein [Bacteroidetes bacterium HGW-Bacteroidetes-13]
MHQIQKVSAVEAKKMILKAFEEAEKISKHIAVAVTGPEGELIAFLRMDGANAASANISQNKAYTAARDRCSTKSLGKKARENQYPLGNWGDLRITGFGGGLPIVQNGQVIGGIGVSGLSEEEDERIGGEAIQSVYGK